MTRLAKMIAALHGRQKSNGGAMVCCPVHQDKTPSLSVDIGRDGGLVVRCFAGCDSVAVLQSLRHLGLDPTAPPDRLEHLRGYVHAFFSGREGDYRAAEKQAAEHDAAAIAADRKRRLTAAGAAWGQAAPIAGTIGEVYFWQRGITIDPPPVLRFQPECWHKSGGTFPAIIAKVQDADGKLCGVHRIYLTKGGMKAPVEPAKLALGPISGGAVRLGDIPDDGAIGLTEGIEDALAVMQMGLASVCWAAISASGMAAFVPPSGVRNITLYRDNDQAGLDAATAAASKLSAFHRIEARIVAPQSPFKDFNAALQCAAKEAF